MRIYLVGEDSNVRANPSAKMGETFPLFASSCTIVPLDGGGASSLTGSRMPELPVSAPRAIACFVSLAMFTNIHNIRQFHGRHYLMGSPRSKSYSVVFRNWKYAVQYARSACTYELSAWSFSFCAR